MPRLVPRFICITLFVTCSIPFFCLPHVQVYAQQDAFTSDTLKYFSLYDLNAALELGFEYEDDQNRRPRRDGEDLQFDVNWKRKRNLFEQRLSLDSDGSIYHRNFLEFRADTAVRFRQEDYSGDFDNDLDENLWEYDFNLKFIKEKPFNFNLFANQFSNRINQDVFQTTEVDTQSFGAFFQYYNQLFPSSLFVITSDVDEDT